MEADGLDRVGQHFHTGQVGGIAIILSLGPGYWIALDDSSLGDRERLLTFGSASLLVRGLSHPLYPDVSHTAERLTAENLHIVNWSDYTLSHVLNESILLSPLCRLRVGLFQG